MHVAHTNSYVYMYQYNIFLMLVVGGIFPLHLHTAVTHCAHLSMPCQTYRKGTNFRGV